VSRLLDNNPLKVRGQYSCNKAIDCLSRVAPTTALNLLSDPFIKQSLGIAVPRIKAKAFHYIGEKSQAAREYELAPSTLLNGQNNSKRLPELYNMILESFELSYNSQCIGILKKYISIDPINSVLYTNLGIIYRVSRNYGQSISYYDQSLKINPHGSIEVSNGLGILSYVEGNEKQAVMHFTRSLRLNLLQLRDTYFQGNSLDGHNLHMLIIALAGIGLGEIALNRLKNALPILKWSPGILTEIMWDIEQLFELNPSLPKITEILSVVKSLILEIDKVRRGLIRDTYLY
jgi:tetratricopeptide (TPR) repeat protein